MIVDILKVAAATAVIFALSVIAITVLTGSFGVFMDALF